MFILFQIGMFLISVIAIRNVFIYIVQTDHSMSYTCRFNMKYILKDKDKYNPTIINVYTCEYV